MTVNFMPENFRSVTPYLSIKGASDALAFYKRAFNATEIFRLPMPNGDIGHAEMMIGNSRIMLSESSAEDPMPSPKALGGSAVGLYVYVEDVDLLFAQAIDAGGKEIQPVEDQFYGDRIGTLEDPFGHVWFLATHKEDLTPEEIGKRAEALFASDNA